MDHNSKPSDDNKSHDHLVVAKHENRDEKSSKNDDDPNLSWAGTLGFQGDKISDHGSHVKSQKAHDFIVIERRRKRWLAFRIEKMNQL